MSPLLYYNFSDYKFFLRKDNHKSKMYRHWCAQCLKDRKYAFKNKILKEPLCHGCKMKQPEVIHKISSSSKGRIQSEETKKKKSNAMYAYYKSNPINRKISRNLRARLNKAIQFNWKTGSAINDLGCTISELKVYLESKWTYGMTWNNYGLHGWHIDHIVPLCKFDLSNSEELKKACHYTNLQPLWAKDNLSKRKVDGTIN